MKETRNSYCFTDVKTGVGQTVALELYTELGVSDDKIEQSKKYFADNVRRVALPCTHKINVEHGTYGAYSRYDIIQHKYAGGGSGYVEVLEIKNPPDNRCGVVLHYRPFPNEVVFVEFKTVQDACTSFEKRWGADRLDKIEQDKGFVRVVNCGVLVPWFYAVGDEDLVGDYALASGLENHPVYRLGQQFIFRKTGEQPRIRTCVGTYVDRSQQTERVVVYFDDGSSWSSASHTWSCTPLSDPVDIESVTSWINTAVREIEQVLLGNKTNFSLNFLDGTQLVGKISSKKKNMHTSAGDYYLKVVYEKDGKRGCSEGWVSAFTPTKLCPSLEAFVTERYKEKGSTVVSLEVTKVKKKLHGPAWTGVLFQKPENTD